MEEPFKEVRTNILEHQYQNDIGLSQFYNQKSEIEPFFFFEIAQVQHDVEISPTATVGNLNFEGSSTPLDKLSKIAFCKTTHWGSSETADPHGCASSSRLKFKVILFLICLATSNQTKQGK